MLLKNCDIWHCRFGHINTTSIRKLAEQNLVYGLNNSSVEENQCEACCTSKAVKAICKHQYGRKTNSILELIHSDVCGPMPVESWGGSKYFLTFVDDFSRKTTVYCLKTKDEVVAYMKQYINRVERDKNRKVKQFRSDNGLEYCNKSLETYFQRNGIKHERSNIETPQMNGTAERVNRTLLNLTHAMLCYAMLC